MSETKLVSNEITIGQKKGSFMPSKSNPISLRFIRNTALTLVVIMLVGAGGWFLGSHQIHSVKGVYALVTGKETTESVAGTQTIDRSQPTNKNVDMSMFWEVWDELEKTFLFKERINYQKMVYGAIEGMTASLDDPYTAFFPPTENKTTKENLSGQFYGVGIQLGYKKDQIVVIAPISGMPAEKAGVKAEDYVLKITDKAKGIDEETYNININDAVEMIRGKE